MPNAKNQSMLSAIKEDLEGAGAVWVVDACGLTVKEVEALRNAVRESGACMKVYKNTVMRIALSEAELPTLDDMLHGPSAFVFARFRCCCCREGRQGIRQVQREPAD